jgi:acyl-CoA synthetase (AMP-forming)/AMP-acid ligase II
LDHGSFDEAAVSAHCRNLIAAYKCPKRFVVLESLGRSPAGKADYAYLRGIAQGEVG